MNNISIQFYHLLSSPLHVALPSLVRVAYERGNRLSITVAPDDYQRIDAMLWEQARAMFLPHGSLHEPHAEHQPILLSETPSIINKANILIITNMLEYSADMPQYQRVLFMFNGNSDAELAGARGLWKKYQQRGYQLTYQKQNENGKWQQQ